MTFQLGNFRKSYSRSYLFDSLAKCATEVVIFYRNFTLSDGIYITLLVVLKLNFLYSCNIGYTAIL